MERISYYLMKGSENDGYYLKPGISNEQARERIGLIEDILGDNYDLRHLRDLVQADMEGRCAVVPDGGYTDNDGKNALKSAMNTCYYHNNPVTRYIVDAVAEKLTREAAEEALKGEKHG